MKNSSCVDENTKVHTVFACKNALDLPIFVFHIGPPAVSLLFKRVRDGVQTAGKRVALRLLNTLDYQRNGTLAALCGHARGAYEFG